MTSHQAEICVIGAGVMGLWAAWEARKAGLNVLLLEADRPGAGASGGVIGALAPHMPDRWNPKKQFQLEALLALPSALAEAEAASGMSAGYGAVGRLQPLLNEGQRERALARRSGAQENWAAHAQMQVLDSSPIPDWITPEAAQYGVIHDTLTARLNPAATCATLAAAITARGGRILHAKALKVAPGRVETNVGTVSAERVIIAAGVNSFDLMTPFTPPALGRAEKGQALLLDAQAPEDLPVIYADGTYVIRHANGSIAIGATSERIFAHPFATDHLLDEALSRAKAFCPAVRGAKVTQRWAGLRPRAAGRDPLIGALPDAPNVFALTGGFKISFGVGQKLAQALIAHIQGARLAVPDSFLPAAHLGMLT